MKAHIQARMTTIGVEARVPLATCAKCGIEKAFNVVAQGAQDGRLQFVLEPPFHALILNRTAVMLCAECVKFVEGALEAMGVEFPKEPLRG